MREVCGFHILQVCFALCRTLRLFDDVSCVLITEAVYAGGA